MRTHAPRVFAFVVLLTLPFPASPASAAVPPDLQDFRTRATAISTQVVARARTAATGQPGYLGVHVETEKNRKLVIADVEPDSPAAKAGVQPKDVLTKVNGHSPSNADDLRDLLESKMPGEEIKLGVLRNGKRLELSATLGTASRPLKLSGRRAVLGASFLGTKEGDGVIVSRTTLGLPAAKAGLKKGDVVVRINGLPVARAADFTDIMADKEPGDLLAMTLRRGTTEMQKDVVLVPDPAGDPDDLSWYTRKFWKQDRYRLAVVPVEFSDVKLNPKITAQDWSESLFSTGTYMNRSNATGQAIFGSVNDYYGEMSGGAFRFEGKIFAPVQVAKKRDDLLPGTSKDTKSGFFTEALDGLLAREGTNVLANVDGLLFLYAGGRVPQVSRGSLFWPHRGNTRYHGKQWPYVICPEGGKFMSSVSLFCHEFGHLLGLPDLYARPENPGSEGMWVWCAMSNQLTGGRPQHFSAWCKEQLGWLRPTVIDPAVKQKLILGPVEGSTTECFKVLVRPDGSEYFLLENRRRKGFDLNLPGEGLLIWRVVRDRPQLEESHGVEGPMGPRVYLRSVPFPSASNSAFTPYTTPSSRAQLGGGLPVHITNIRQLDDGRISFYVGYEYE